MKEWDKAVNGVMDKDMQYECVECGDKTIVLAGDFRKDGRTCNVCGGYSSPIGFIGVDLANGNDQTVVRHTKETVYGMFGIPANMIPDIEERTSQQLYEFYKFNQWYPPGVK